MTLDDLVDPFRRILDFDGRSTRAQFWPLLGVYLLASSFAKSWSPSESIAGGMVDMNLFTRDQVMIDGIVFALFLIPISTAITRRLHDIGLSGFWALSAGIIYVVDMVLRIMIMPDALAGHNLLNSPLYTPMWINGMASNLFWGGLIVACCLKGAEQENRFGTPVG